MEKTIFVEKEVRRGVLKSDNSDYFSKWGSRKPELTIREEIDNQIAAKPTFAGIQIINKPGGCSSIQTFNDGKSPTHDRMERMLYIGKTVSDRNGASICGVGQIEGLIAGRKTPKSTGTLTFKSANGGEVSTFKCIANGTDYSIITENSGPWLSDEVDSVDKIYDGMKAFSDDDIKAIKVIAAMKIYPYHAEHPDFVYTVNGERITPFDILYGGVEHEMIKRLDIKEFTAHYHGREYLIKYGAVYVGRYVKPDGKHMVAERADALHRLYNMGPKSGGVFVELGGVNVITGGRESWKFIAKNQHSTDTGQRIWISIPSDGELKDIIFAESQNKASVNICLDEIRDYDGREVFKEMLEDIKNHLNSWKNEKVAMVNSDIVSKEDEERILSGIYNNHTFISSFVSMLSILSDDEKAILGKKKFNTLVKEFLVKENNKKEEPCYTYAQ